MNSSTTEKLIFTWHAIFTVYHRLHKLFGNIFLIGILVVSGITFGLLRLKTGLYVCILWLHLLLYPMSISVDLQKNASVWQIQDKTMMREHAQLHDQVATQEVEITTLKILNIRSQATKQKSRSAMIADKVLTAAEKKDQELDAKDKEILKLTKSLSAAEAQFKKSRDQNMALIAVVEQWRKQKTAGIQAGSGFQVVVNNAYPSDQSRRHK